jgi:cellulose synthase/poly-beta-1,6-N-acetylglucosamine synthase-like glycosyltransferase
VKSAFGGAYFTERIPVKVSKFLVLAGAVLLAGCGIEEPIERVTLEPRPYVWRLPGAYKDIRLGKSTSVDVLEGVKRYKSEIISESESVIASCGEKKKTYQFWLTMVGFDEEDFTVTRKYVLAVDEKPWYINWNIKTRGQKLRFDAEITIDEDTLTEPYTSENQKRIAIMRKALENFRDDIMQVRQDNMILDAGAMMTNQTFERILYILDKSPAFATKIDRPKGLDFDHLTLGKGRVQMAIKNNVVTFKIRIGSPLSLIWDAK